MDLRLSSEEFWDLTPRETSAMYDAYLKRTQRECWVGPAQICAILAEINRDQKKRKKPYRTSDFIPGRKAEPQDPYAVIRRMDAFADRAKQVKEQRRLMEQR